MCRCCIVKSRVTILELIIVRAVKVHLLQSDVLLYIFHTTNKRVCVMSFPPSRSAPTPPGESVRAPSGGRAPRVENHCARVKCQIGLEKDTFFGTSLDSRDNIWPETFRHVIYKTLEQRHKILVKCYFTS